MAKTCRKTPGNSVPARLRLMRLIPPQHKTRLLNIQSLFDYSFGFQKEPKIFQHRLEFKTVALLAF